MKNNKEVTIYDIAQKSGFAPGTVSRALNNMGYVKEETRKKIEKVAAELEYIPHQAAVTLKTKKTGLLLLAIPDMDNPFYFDLIRSIQEIVQQNNNSLILYYTEGKVEQELKAINMMQQEIADGMIMINLSYNEQYRLELKKLKRPVVLCNMCVGDIGGKVGDPFDFVGVDTKKGMYNGAVHLIKQGHSKIGYIGGNKKYNAFKERYEGYVEALQEHSLKIDEKIIYFDEYWGEGTGYRAGEHIVKLAELPTAICVANDLMAIGLLRSFDEHKILIPDNIAIIGMDNIDLTYRLQPKLSTISIAQGEIGRKAAEIIYQRIKGFSFDKPQKIIFEPRIIVRESSIQIQANK